MDDHVIKDLESYKNTLSDTMHQEHIHSYMVWDGPYPEDYLRIDVIYGEHVAPIYQLFEGHRSSHDCIVSTQNKEEAFVLAKERMTQLFHKSNECSGNGDHALIDEAIAILNAHGFDPRNGKRYQVVVQFLQRVKYTHESLSPLKAMIEEYDAPDIVHIVERLMKSL